MNTKNAKISNHNDLIPNDPHEMIEWGKKERKFREESRSLADRIFNNKKPVEKKPVQSLNMDQIVAQVSTKIQSDITSGISKQIAEGFKAMEARLTAKFENLNNNTQDESKPKRGRPKKEDGQEEEK